MTPPKDPRGYTLNELREMTTDEEYARLVDWLYGQTCAVNDAGEHLIYPWDVRRGIALIRRGTPTHWD